MKIIEQRFLRGPNVYASTACLLAVVELCAGDPLSSQHARGMADGLLELLPGVRQRYPGSAYPAGFAPHLRLGVMLPSVLEQVTMELQRSVGAAVSFGCTRAVAGRWHVVCAYQAEAVVAEAMSIALDLVNGLARGAACSLDDGLGRLRAVAARCAIGTSTGAVLRAARRRGIPSVRLSDGSNLFLLGWGKRQRRLQATITGATGHVAVGIAGDKQLTKTLLAQAGLPVPEGETVSGASQACAVAARLGTPVTIKPQDANQGKGVSTTCVTVDEITAAFAHARQYSRRVIVERFLAGRDYRVLVTGTRVAAASWRRPPEVRGDGLSSVRELVERENRHPARGEGHSNILTQIALDEHALAHMRKQGLDPDSVLPDGQVLQLRGNANLSTGGTAEDVTDLLPQETVRICVRAARTIGLDIAGIDIVCEDIGRPLREQGGGIIEVNAAPGIRMHEYPSRGQPRDAGDAIAEAMFGAGDGRIPVIAVSGCGASSGAARLIVQAGKVAGLTVGSATGDGVRVGEVLTIQGDATGFSGARTVLADPEVELAVLETSSEGVLHGGLGFDRCDVAVIAHPHEGEELARAQMVLARSAARAVVLNAGEHASMALAAQVQAGVEVVYFAQDADSPVLRHHLAVGGRALYAQGGALVLAIGQCRQQVFDGGPRGANVSGLAASNVADVLAACAALIGAGFAHQAVAAGMQSVVMCDASFPGAAASNVMPLVAGDAQAA